ncbi:hypothetical protein Arnit_2149 [Arcobacter nitrofigilis DSM 7299]|uniref:Uncharacterized protein n=1 Tax=Arcobacter nitrofigilis (strain ATCC 33309 / DSM 7299 / CCUG 15893 / LMG 7604 / NCTC 12251 / CI) TaxID=572480 RepID=D5V0J0_ARCNC|nr:hypothetical protein [Arcobacter nitrofigilis]ADG93802.1 hypothetical protein Arnit_2149 [Arcobacter nitrofigilis DSM 7299]
MISNEIKNEQIELIPDKDGFLFEIENKMYLVTQVYIIVFFSALFLLLFYLADFSLTNIYEDGRLGRLVIVFSIPGYFYYIIKTLYYVFIQKRKVIKFYKNYILLPNDISIVLEDVKKIEKVKLNLLSGMSKKISASMSKKLLYLCISPFLLIAWFLLFCCTFTIYKRNTIDNLMFFNNKNERLSGIGYGLMNKEEEFKVKLYFEEYSNINIDEVKEKLVFLT